MTRRAPYKPPKAKPLDIDGIRRAIVDRTQGVAGSTNRLHAEHNIGVLRGLLWALTGEDPGQDACGDLVFVLTTAGIPYKTKGSIIEYPLPGEPEWPNE